LLNDRG